MATISLPLPANVLYEHPQTVEFDKIATFIGSNGSGKSTILKSIFDEKLSSSTYDELKVVCFSSGQNESYSNNFSAHLSSERQKRNALNLDCFYYDKTWSKLLIFLATTSKHDGLVRDFLKQNSYVVENELDEDETTKLSFKVKVDKSYTNIVKQAIEDEEKGETDVITNKAYHRTLHNFIKALISDEYNFEDPVELTTIELSQDILSKISFESDTGESFDSKVMFFTQAADNDFFIVKDSFDLIFEKAGVSLALEHLSDGEYQLLFLYALIDTFDSEETLFLLDEADSHLHYKNIDKLWGVFNRLQGKAITTTHLLDSIAKAGPERLMIIDEGKIEPATSPFKLLQRLESLSEVEAVQQKIVSMYKNVVVMDHAHDWEIFKLLVKKKMPSDNATEIEIKLANFICVGVHSGFPDGHDNNMFGSNKIRWLHNYANSLAKLDSKIQNAFLICDRDDFSYNLIGTRRNPFIVKGHNFKPHKNLPNSYLLSWKRREIKHYLLSYTALGQECDKINRHYVEGWHLKANENGDNGIEGEFNHSLAKHPSKPVKELVEPYINIDGKGFCVEKAQAYINQIPRAEISEDIINMYNYLVGNHE